MKIPHQRLEYFKATVDAGSVRGAAAFLGIAPSAVSRQLVLLEAELGAPVCERSRHGMLPTEVGDMLLHHYHRHAALDLAFRQELDAYLRLETGRISLRVGEGFVGDLIDAPLHAFTERYQGVQIEVDTGSTSEIINAVVHDETHIGLMYHGDAHPQLRFWFSSLQPLMALMAPSYSLAQSETALSLDQLAQEPIALWRAGHGVRQLVDEGFRMAGRTPTISMQTNSLSVLKHAARSGMTITLLPAFAAARELDDGVLVARAVDSPLFFRGHAHVVTRVGRSVPRAGMQLLRHLERWMRAFRSSETNQ